MLVRGLALEVTTCASHKMYESEMAAQKPLLVSEES
jgi:hypothetical protein